MLQYRLSTLLLTFVVVWSALAVFGAVGGTVAAAFLLGAAIYIRSARSKIRASIYMTATLLIGLCLFTVLPPAVQSPRCDWKTRTLRQQPSNDWLCPC